MNKFNNKNRNKIVFVDRYTNLEMPVYAFLPGINQHPDKNHQQKHIPELSDTDEWIRLENWQNSQAYLYAIDLFNRAYYWEVHEVLEYLWMKNGKNSETAIFLKGIIQLAVSLLKKKLGNKHGAERLLKKAIIHLQRKEKIYLGIDVKKLINECEKYIQGEISTSPLITLIF